MKRFISSVALLLCAAQVSASYHQIAWHESLQRTEQRIQDERRNYRWYKHLWEQRYYFIVPSVKSAVKIGAMWYGMWMLNALWETL